MIVIIALAALDLLAASKPSTDDLLRDLKDSEPKVRANAAKELGERGETLGIEALEEATKDMDPRVQMEVVIALGKIQHEAQPSSLSIAVRNTRGEAQEKAMELLVELYLPPQDMNAFQGLWKSIQDIFSPAHPSAVEPWVNVHPEAVEALVFVLDQQESENRIRAAAALGILRAESAIPRLVHYLKSPNSKMVRTCIRSLGYIGRQDTGEYLIPLLKHSDNDVVIDAVRVLGAFRYKPALPELRQFFEYTDKKEFKRIAMQAISRLGDPSAEDLMRQHLESKDKDLRQYAIEGIGRMGLTQYVDPLLKYYQREKSQQIKLALCFSLFHLGESAYIDSIVLFIEDRNYGDQVREYLVELGSKAVPGVAGYLKKSDKQYQIRLIHMLGDMHQPSAIPYLEPYMQNEDLKVAQAATDAVRELKRVEGSD